MATPQLRGMWGADKGNVADKEIANTEGSSEEAGRTEQECCDEEIVAEVPQQSVLPPGPICILLQH